MTDPKHAHQVASCPQCGKLADVSASNPQRPFCSKRCKLIDLGDWLDERNTIADENDGAPWNAGFRDEPGDDRIH